MPSGQFPVILAGMDYTADLIQSLALPWAWKAADLPRSNTTTLASDPDLSIAVAANAAYHVWGWVYATGAAISTADIKLAWSAPSGAAGAWDGLGYSTASTTVSLSSGAGLASSRSFGVNGANFSSVRIEAYVTTTTAGSLALQWAQNTSNATATTLKAGSRLIAVRVQ